MARWCFGRWDEKGELTTYQPSGQLLHASICQVKTDPEAERLAETYASGTAKRAGETNPPLAVVGLGSMVSPSHLSIDAPGLVDAGGGLRASYWLSLHRSWRWLSLALAHGNWWTSNDLTQSMLFGVMPGVRIRHGFRLAYEASVELGARSYSVRPIADDGAVANRFWLWTVYGGLRVGGEVALTNYLALHLSGFWERDVEREVTREQTFDTWYKSRTQEVNWRYGGQLFGALLEFRISVR